MIHITSCTFNALIKDTELWRLVVSTLYLFRWFMLSRLGESTALLAYLHISSYATLAMLSLINRSNAFKSRTYPRRGLYTCFATGQQL